MTSVQDLRTANDLSNYIVLINDIMLTSQMTSV